jgi:CubicO group peptidase (beta-lactamase class C family)
MTGQVTTVHGTTAPGYERVRDTFAAVLSAEPANAAQVAAYVDGEWVVDLWGGGPEITGDSLVPIYSCTKGAAHLAVAMLVQDGTLDLDREVRQYWPEFGAEGKDTVTLRDLLAHRAGVVGADPGFTSEESADDLVIAARLAVQRPFWRPGAAFGYHALSIGALTGEVVRRATGLTMREFYAKHLQDARGLDLFIGLPAEHEPRFLGSLPLEPTPEQQVQLAAARTADDSLAGIAFNRNGDPHTTLDQWGSLPHVRAKGNASAGGVGSARGLARMYAAAISTVDGAAPLLTPATQAAFAQIHSSGEDLVLRMQAAFALGFQNLAKTVPSASAAAFGHSGAGGSMAFADPRTGIGFGYTRRRFRFMADPRTDVLTLTRTLRECAGR